MKRILLFIVFVINLTVFQAIFTIDANSKILGQFDADGYSQISSNGKDWITVNGLHPVSSGTFFMTTTGRFSLLMKDGTMLMLPNNSEMTLTGDETNYTVVITRGTMSFNIPEDSKLRVITPGTNINVNGQDKSELDAREDNTVGEVSYNNSQTEIKALTGSLQLTDSQIEKTLSLAPGQKMVIQNQDPISGKPEQAITKQETISEEKIKTKLYFTSSTTVQKRIPVIDRTIRNDSKEQGSRIISVTGRRPNVSPFRF